MRQDRMCSRYSICSLRDNFKRKNSICSLLTAGWGRLHESHGEKVMPSIGDRIKERRTELGWTQDQLAQKTNLSKGFLSDLENNKRGVRGRNSSQHRQGVECRHRRTDDRSASLKASNGSARPGFALGVCFRRSFVLPASDGALGHAAPDHCSS